MTALSSVVFTHDAARALTDEVKADAATLWSKLLQLYEGGAHEALGYSSWGAYYEAEFNESGRRGYQLLDAARVLDALVPVNHGSTPQPQERVARELMPVLREDTERVEEVWAEVVEEHGPAPTAAQVREHVSAHKATKPESQRFMFVTELRLQHEASDIEAAHAWVQRTVSRLASQGVITVHKATRSA